MREGRRGRRRGGRPLSEGVAADVEEGGGGRSVRVGEAGEEHGGFLGRRSS